MMQKFLRYGTMVMALLCVVGLIALGVSSIGAYRELTAQAEISSGDYLRYGLLYGTAFLVTSIVGVAMGFLCKKYTEKTWQNVVCNCVVFVSCLGVLVAGYFWFKFGFM